MYIYTNFLGIITYHFIVLRVFWLGFGLKPSYRLRASDTGGPIYWKVCSIFSKFF